MAKQKFWNSEKLMSTSAVLISILTLAVFIYQTNLIRKEQHTAVFPYLELSHNGIETDSYSFTLKNKGIGPALITNVKLLYKGKEIEEGLIQFIGQNRDSSQYAFRYNALYKNRLISAGEELTLIEASEKNRAAAAYFERILMDQDLDLEIRYESIYGEQWEIQKRRAGVQKLD